ncbi:protein bfr2-like [Acanthaster planci]|uniref:Protein bfr2-like n=1 Tax=Acanthaster planci TaxID=133434 RepID=A0A8B7YCJ7_ACAPL|nr:protein bfr2-like [Acanthaster planci]
MGDPGLCRLRSTNHAVAVGTVLLLIATLGAAETDDAPYFPKCKASAGAMDIAGLIDKDPCMFRCPPTVSMVCSNDGMSHMNDCFLCKSACHNPGRPIFKVCDGRCPCKGEPHDEDMEASEDCVDGECKTDSKDHYGEDYGFDVESPDEKYASPVYKEGDADVLHESKGYEADPTADPLAAAEDADGVDDPEGAEEKEEEDDEEDDDDLEDLEAE